MIKGTILIPCLISKHNDEAIPKPSSKNMVLYCLYGLN